MANVLVTDGQLRSALVAVRTLARGGHRVTVGEDTRLATSAFSRFAAGRCAYPAAATAPDAFSRWLDGFVRRRGIDVVLPVDDAVTEALARRPPPCATLVPTLEAFATFRNKDRTVAAAKDAGVPVPPTVTADPRCLEEQAARLGFPLVVKTSISSGGRGYRRVVDATGLRAALEALDADQGRPLLQRWIPGGTQFDVCLLYDRRGRRVAHFVQRELRHYPLEGGPSTLQESVHRSDLVDLAARLVETVGWTGPVEVEFRCDSSGTPWLMEANPRFWSSLGLAVAAGVDFPRLAVELALGRGVTPPPGYRAGLRCRWLLPGDILHYFANPNRSSMVPPFWHTYDTRTCDDILAWDDPGPAVGVALAAIRYLVNPRLRRFVLR